MDLYARRRLEKQQNFLVDVGKALEESLDYETNIQNLNRLLMPDFAAWSLTYGLGIEEVPHVRVLSHEDPAKRTALTSP